MEDKRIVEALQQGEPDAFQNMYIKYRKPLFAYAYTILKDIENAEDVIQDRFLYLLNRPANFWGRITDLRSYLYKTIYNACLHVIRDSGSLAKKTSKYTYHITSRHINEGAEIEWQMEQEDRSAVLQPMLNKLGKQCRRAIELVYLDGESYLDAAKKMGISKDSIKTHLSIGKAYFRKRIDTLTNLCVVVLLSIFYS